MPGSPIWTMPRDWSFEEVVTETHLDEQVRDNLLWLYDAVAKAGAPVCGFRLSLESGVPVSTTDQAAKTTLYVTPASHNRAPVYDGSSWSMLSSAQLSLSLAGLTANLPYDVFAYSNSGTLAAELLAWSSASARAIGLVWQDGILVKSGATSRTYLGSVCINATGGQTDDTLEARLVWSHYNRVPRALARHDTTASWSTPTSWGQVRGQAANRVRLMVGWPDALLSLTARLVFAMPMNTTYGAATALGEDSTSTPLAGGVMEGAVVSGNSADFTVGLSSVHQVDKCPSAGAHDYNWLEYGSAAMTAYGAQSGTYWKTRSGLTGFLLG